MIVQQLYPGGPSVSVPVHPAEELDVASLIPGESTLSPFDPQFTCILDDRFRPLYHTPQSSNFLPFGEEVFLPEAVVPMVTDEAVTVQVKLDENGVPVHIEPSGPLPPPAPPLMPYGSPLGPPLHGHLPHCQLARPDHTSHAYRSQHYDYNFDPDLERLLEQKIDEELAKSYPDEEEEEPAHQEQKQGKVEHEEEVNSDSQYASMSEGTTSPSGEFSESPSSCPPNTPCASSGELSRSPPDLSQVEGLLPSTSPMEELLPSPSSASTLCASSSSTTLVSLSSSPTNSCILNKESSSVVSTSAVGDLSCEEAGIAPVYHKPHFFTESLDGDNSSEEIVEAEAEGNSDEDSARNSDESSNTVTEAVTSTEGSAEELLSQELVEGQVGLGVSKEEDSRIEGTEDVIEGTLPEDIRETSLVAGEESSEHDLQENVTVLPGYIVVPYLTPYYHPSVALSYPAEPYADPAFYSSGGRKRKKKNGRRRAADHSQVDITMADMLTGEPCTYAPEAFLNSMDPYAYSYAYPYYCPPQQYYYPEEVPVCQEHLMEPADEDGVSNSEDPAEQAIEEKDANNKTEEVVFGDLCETEANEIREILENNSSETECQKEVQYVQDPQNIETIPVADSQTDEILEMVSPNLDTSSVELVPDETIKPVNRLTKRLMELIPEETSSCESLNVNDDCRSIVYQSIEPDLPNNLDQISRIDYNDVNNNEETNLESNEFTESSDYTVSEPNISEEMEDESSMSFIEPVDESSFHIEDVSCLGENDCPAQINISASCHKEILPASHNDSIEELNSVSATVDNRESTVVMNHVESIEDEILHNSASITAVTDDEHIELNLSSCIAQNNESSSCDNIVDNEVESSNDSSELTESICTESESLPPKQNLCNGEIEEQEFDGCAQSMSTLMECEGRQGIADNDNTDENSLDIDSSESSKSTISGEESESIELEASIEENTLQSCIVAATNESVIEESINIDQYESIEFEEISYTSNKLCDDDPIADNSNNECVVVKELDSTQSADIPSTEDEYIDDDISDHSELVVKADVAASSSSFTLTSIASKKLMGNLLGSQDVNHTLLFAKLMRDEECDSISTSSCLNDESLFSSTSSEMLSPGTTRDSTPRLEEIGDEDLKLEPYDPKECCDKYYKIVPEDEDTAKSSLAAGSPATSLSYNSCNGCTSGPKLGQESNGSAVGAKRASVGSECSVCVSSGLGSSLVSTPTTSPRRSRTMGDDDEHATTTIDEAVSSLLLPAGDSSHQQSCRIM